MEHGVLECRALTKCYGAQPALNGLDLRLEAGRIVGLLGPNGSGKTTLMKLACGLLVPTSGQIWAAGHVPGPESKKRVAYLPERAALSPTLRAREAVQLYRDFFADFDAGKATDMLADLGIGPKDKISAMSKGTREKLQLALVMSRAAQLYLLDEPIGGVDPAARDYILDTIIRNYQENSTLVLATHLIGDIEKVLDEAVMLQGGKVRLAGPVDDLRQQHGESLDALFREVFKC